MPDLQKKAVFTACGEMNLLPQDVGVMSRQKTGHGEEKAGAAPGNVTGLAAK